MGITHADNRMNADKLQEILALIEDFKQSVNELEKKGLALKKLVGGKKDADDIEQLRRKLTGG